MSARRQFCCLEVDAKHLPIIPHQMIEAKALGLLLKDDALVVGDIVELEYRASEWLITKVIPRKNAIFRNLQRENKQKILASNIDYLILVFSMEKPDFKRGLLDRYLLRSSQWNIPSLIVWNKSDLMTKETDWDFEYLRLKPLNLEFFCTNAKDPSAPSPLSFAKSFSELDTFLKHKTVIFMGQSGVGKSKLIQTLAQEKIQTKSSALGVVGKGVHTTSWTELHALTNFNLMDSPGIRSLSLSDVDQNQLLEFMPDLYAMSSKCQFHNCQHQAQAKGCVFSKADLSAEIQTRYQSYLRFKEEISSGQEWDKD